MRHMHRGVVAEGLVKRFGDFTALRGVDFEVKEATVVGLLGPNGAGKTTAIRILTTLLRLDGGHATVAGHDVAREPQLVRSVIGLTGQYAAVDEDLTGRENLVLVGRLSRMRKPDAFERAAELLGGFELADAADRTLRTYSGGMRRRLDLAASLMVAPPVLFLDEPTTGLDPRSRLQLWEVINGLRTQGTTIVLTTQYLEEADQLADRISVLDLGRIIAEGTADELKRQVGGDVVDLQLADRSHTAAAAAALAQAFGVEHGEITIDDDLGEVRVPVASGANALIDAVRALDAEHVPVADLGLRRPSLDDVFLSLTGHHVEESGPAPPRTEAPERAPGRRGMIG
jgi:ABC-2 type transport system ATP-binding protein